MTWNTSTTSPCGSRACSLRAWLTGKTDYIALWKTLNPDPAVPEVIRNFPVRQPLLWMAKPGNANKG